MVESTEKPEATPRQTQNILKQPDRYGGIVMTSEELPEDFPAQMPSLIENWRAAKIRSV